METTNLSNKINKIWQPFEAARLRHVDGLINYNAKVIVSRKYIYTSALDVASV